jgi:hypothetical protein
LCIVILIVVIVMHVPGTNGSRIKRLLLRSMQV